MKLENPLFQVFSVVMTALTRILRSPCFLLKRQKARDLREEESLSNSRKALEISERATLSSERATRIAISAIILTISMIILEFIGIYP